MNKPPHPDDLLLDAFATGALPAAPSLVVAAHLETCAACRRAVDHATEVAGAVFAHLPDAPLSPAALAATLARLDGPFATSPSLKPAQIPGTALPAVVQAAGLGRRRWFGRGAWVAHTRLAHSRDWRSFLLALPAGGRLPRHTHEGAEYTLVLDGAFRDEDGWHRGGDFVTTRIQGKHEIRVSDRGPCVCLVATEGPLRWTNPWIRLTTALTGI